MKALTLAIPEYKGRVAPLLDVAGRFVVGNSESPEEKFYLNAASFPDMARIQRLKDSGVNIIICSAISEVFAKLLQSSGIEIVPGVIGSIDDIISAFFNDRLNTDQFAMPGCEWRRRYRGRRCPYYSQIFSNDDKRRNTK
jgi:predicted Fe-Mo cluster-binding NifX family protein